MPALDHEPYWPSFLARLEATVRRLPAHLIREEDIRAALRDAVLDHHPRHADPWSYCPEADNVDVVLLGDTGHRHLVELKLWHATLKPGLRDGVVRSGSDDGTESHVVDFAKQLTRSRRDSAPTWFVSLTQGGAHPLARGPRWQRSGEAGPFLTTRPGPNAVAQSWLAELHGKPQGGVTETRLPAYVTRSRSLDLALPGTPLSLRLAARARWGSGGGPEWACDFDLHAWEVQAMAG